MNYAVNQDLHWIPHAASLLTGVRWGEVPGTDCDNRTAKNEDEKIHI
jgi:hypothetical protein